MNASFRVALLCLAFGTGACGSGGESGGDTATAEDKREGVFDPMVSTIDRARGVEELNEDRKSRLDAELEASGAN